MGKVKIEIPPIVGIIDILVKSGMVGRRYRVDGVVGEGNPFLDSCGNHVSGEIVVRPELLEIGHFRMDAETKFVCNQCGESRRLEEING